MKTVLLVPDAGPLFSFAAADLLGVLLRATLVVTDVVKQETIDRGALEGASVEAKRLFDFYNTNARAIEVRRTTIGHLLSIARQADAHATARNLGELSIQSLLIELRHAEPHVHALVVFEDAWFSRHASSMPPNCTLLSTNALLLALEREGLIPSAREAEAAIRTLRPTYEARVKRICPGTPDAQVIHKARRRN